MNCHELRIIIVAFMEKVQKTGVSIRNMAAEERKVIEGEGSTLLVFAA